MWSSIGLIWISIFLLPILFASDGSSASQQPAEVNAGGVVALVILFVFFVATGIFFLIGPHLLRRSWARRTSYVLTDQRAISITTGRHRTIHAEFLRNVPILNEKVRSDGSGSIGFGNVRSWSVPPAESGFGIWGAHLMPFVLLFWEIPDVEAVYALADQHRRDRLQAR
jgi:hypothetical protein